MQSIYLLMQKNPPLHLINIHKIIFLYTRNKRKPLIIQE